MNRLKKITAKEKINHDDVITVSIIATDWQINIMCSNNFESVHAIGHAMEVDGSTN